MREYLLEKPNLGFTAPPTPSGVMASNLRLLRCFHKSVREVVADTTDTSDVGTVKGPCMLSKHHSGRAIFKDFLNITVADLCNKK